MKKKKYVKPTLTSLRTPILRAQGFETMGLCGGGSYPGDPSGSCTGGTLPTSYDGECVSGSSDAVAGSVCDSGSFPSTDCVGGSAG